MERYETARIEVEQFEEDVITASVVRCEQGTCDSDMNIWMIYYSDGDFDEYYGEEKPDFSR